MSIRELDTLLNARRFRVVRVKKTSSSGADHEREVIRHPGSVVVLPLLEDGRICLIRNYRAAVDEELIELPAGTLEPHEPPLDCAERELTEETGYTARHCEPLCDFFAAPGILDEHMHLFVASGLDAGSPCREPGEEIENLLVTWDEALAMVRDGRIHDAKTICGLLYYHTFRGK